jgi:pyridoxal phosphate enzyme (YggS family)
VTGEEAIAARLAAVRERVRRAAVRAGLQPERVALVGVAKRKPSQLVAAAVRAGLRDIGENYLQEAREKIPKVKAELEATGVPEPRWHFVGQLQRNKAREVARSFDVVETVDRESLGRELDRRARSAERTLDVLLQVNLSDEPQKGGVDPQALPDLLAASRVWSNLRVVGLMTIPAAAEDPEASRPAFARLRKLAEALRGAPGGDQLRELSMGMSADFEVAIEEGATIVRIGTEIFGPEIFGPRQAGGAGAQRAEGERSQKPAGAERGEAERSPKEE